MKAILTIILAPLMVVFDVLWHYSTAKASRTWIAHGLVCLVTAFALAALALLVGLPGLLTQAVVGTLMAFWFVIRELKDEQKHKAEGLWNVPQWEDKVTYAADMAGDLLGPLFVAATLWAAFLIDRL